MSDEDSGAANHEGFPLDAAYDLALLRFLNSRNPCLGCPHERLGFGHCRCNGPFQQDLAGPQGGQALELGTRGGILQFIAL
jgi:hypothetical protein